jgi:hypothetical protein
MILKTGRTKTQPNDDTFDAAGLIVPHNENKILSFRNNRSN